MSESPLRHWDYRVIEFVTPDGQPWRAIHEVHYENNVPWGYSEGHAAVTSDAEDMDAGLRWVLDRMREALEKPVLVDRDFDAPEGT